MSNRLNPEENYLDRRLCVAPMMGKTDRHFRSLLRIASPNSFLFTEMISIQSLIHGNLDRLLTLSSMESPLALQLGGNDPGELSKLSKLAELKGFSEVNLNVGCPSHKVQRGQFGACLMLDPLLVKQCVAEMKRKTSLPITVKCRLGVDDQDSDTLLNNFVGHLADAKCDAIYLHARKALLNGLTPAQNRSIPPIEADRVYRLKKNFPNLPIVFNGEIKTTKKALGHLRNTNGIMVGRAACSSPLFISELDNLIFKTDELKTEQIVDKYLCYMDREIRNGTLIHSMTKQLLCVLKGYTGAREHRRLLSDPKVLKNMSMNFLRDLLKNIQTYSA